jgi:hypothetical protein
MLSLVRWVYRLPLPRYGHFWSGVFSKFSLKNHQRRTISALTRCVCRLPLPRNGHFRSWIIFGIFRQKSSKKDHFSFGPMGLSFADAEIRSLRVWGNFGQKSSKVGCFSFRRAILSFAESEIQPLAVSRILRILRQKPSK